jgi:hypothetical protein
MAVYSTHTRKTACSGALRAAWLESAIPCGVQASALSVSDLIRGNPDLRRTALSQAPAGRQADKMGHG